MTKPAWARDTVAPYLLFPFLHRMYRASGAWATSWKAIEHYARAPARDRSSLIGRKQEAGSRECKRKIVTACGGRRCVIYRTQECQQRGVPQRGVRAHQNVPLSRGEGRSICFASQEEERGSAALLSECQKRPEVFIFACIFYCAEHRQHRRYGIVVGLRVFLHSIAFKLSLRLMKFYIYDFLLVIFTDRVL